jgi:NadR type nicotinamide-nucleotide adenylyltransferase
MAARPGRRGDSGMTATPEFRARTVVLHGPESTGKSVLSERLAERFGGVFVPEYGRTYCEIHGADCDAQDLLNIAAGQDAAIDEAGRQTAGLIVSDTDALLTEVWSLMMLGESCFKDAPPRVSGALYLLTDIDTPFIQDDLRVYGGFEDRQRFLELSEAALKQYGVDYVRLSGSWAQREAAACAAIESRFQGLLNPKASPTLKP